jgi:uncharacterized membrane protein YdjX (TVP38/TMEM64 family)
VAKRAVIASIVIGALLLVGTLARNALGMEWSAESIRATIADAGVWAPILFIALVALRVVVLIPSQILLAGAGLLFGTALGTLYGALGLTVSALMNFALVRLVGAGAIRDQIPERFHGALALARSKAGAGAVALATGYPIGPVTGVQLAAALTGMSFVTYLVAVSVGATARAATYSYLGSTLLEGSRVYAGLAVLALVAVVPWLFPRTRAWLRQTLEKPSGP